MIKYMVLGIMQGLTEFLPVSSSGHLVIIGRFLGIRESQAAAAVILHLGTILALVIFFFKEILKLLRDLTTLFLIIIVTLITGLIGIWGRDFFESLFKTPKLVAISLIFTGVILILTKFTNPRRYNLNVKDALILGIIQGIAIIPGISRSGSTISSLLFRGIEPKLSFNFSFLAAIPAILGATILEFKDTGLILQQGRGNLIIGFIFSFLSGIFSLWLLKRILNKARIYYFGYYCILMGVFSLIFVK
ncbi:MAG: undecaprenyl-diphosphate phosphatase [Candidatus Omnitrophica bacterium]|nr:undecaprenyl-diphosphate phosphatase [Candidatus Omnitrophota bacterium]